MSSQKLVAFSHSTENSLEDHLRLKREFFKSLAKLQWVIKGNLFTVNKEDRTTSSVKKLKKEIVPSQAKKHRAGWWQTSKISLKLSKKKLVGVSPPCSIVSLHEALHQNSDNFSVRKNYCIYRLRNVYLLRLLWNYASAQLPKQFFLCDNDDLKLQVN